MVEEGARVLELAGMGVAGADEDGPEGFVEMEEVEE